MTAQKSLTGFDRVMATVSGNQTDRQPYTLLHSLYGSRLVKAETNEYYRNPDLWFEGQQAVLEVTDPDIVIAPFSFALEAEAFGSEIVFLPKNPPNIKRPFISDLSEIVKIQPPDPDKNSSLQYFLRANRLLVQEYGTRKAIAPVLQSPCDLPSLLMGFEMWIDTLLFHPEESREVLRKTTEYFIRMGNRYLSDGATFLVVTVNFANPMIITGAILKKLMPFLQEAFGKINGPIVLHSGGCTVVPFLQEYIKLPNVIAIVMDPGESFEKAREIVGENFVLMGNLDGPNLVHMSHNEVQKRTLGILEDRKKDPHFIFATSNADIPWDTPLDTIRRMVDTLRNFNKYDHAK